jgi:hypothetical protein
MLIVELNKLFFNHTHNYASFFLSLPLSLAFADLTEQAPQSPSEPML